MDESGISSITEVTVALGMFAIVLLITTLVLQTLSQTSDTATRRSYSTENVQLATSQIEQYMAGAVSPNTAASSSTLAGSSNNYSGQISTFPCWGSSQPYSSGGQLPVPQTTAIIIAHDYDFEFCGYVPGTSAPHVPNVIRIYMTTPCSATLNTCTLDVLDYTVPKTGFTSCTAAGSTSCTSTNTYTATTSAQYKTLLTLANVSCDSTCQSGISSTATTGSAGVNSAVASEDAASCTASSATPPLFSYYGADGPTASGTGCPSGALNPSGGASGTLIDITSNNAGAGCAPTPSSGSDCATLQNIQSVQLDLTVVGSRSPGATPVKKRPQSTTVTDLVYVPSLQTAFTVPYAPTGVTATAGSTTGTAKVSWSVPYDGGTDICEFVILAYQGTTQKASQNIFTTALSPPCSGGGTVNYVDGSTDTGTISGLVSGQSYTFTVTAINSTTINGDTVGGASTPSLPSNSVTSP